MTQRRKVVLERARVLSPSVRELGFRLLDGAPLVYQPGQWLNLHVPVAGQLLRRSYSIASAPDEAQPDGFELAVTRVDKGPVSTALHGLEVGAELEVDAPEGFFTRGDYGDEPALMIATGSGLAPVRAMLQAELKRAEGPRLTLLFGCRSEQDILWRDELERFEAEHARFELCITLSRGSAEWPGARGHVQRHLPALSAAQAGERAYICGLRAMVDEVRRVLKQQLGYDRRRIHSERYD
ncbi:MAG: FAD-dependent oxidoreductase [Myxococcales bacterium]|nr:FAD-dependent oxidoreductase [Myxococcales bacterium]